ncbi:MAG: dTDP-glucose 4,6-dehydratase [Anaerocolumna sp.]|jgi:dTDP-glucose 4,6-dehydratase|nr:dTDP-glucose 4,6-dehydratase [Anaerocolumna sp.]
MKTYLITGGAGFIGSNYIHYLMEKSQEEIQILNLDALTYCGRKENLNTYEGSADYHFIQGDIRNEELITSLFSEYPIDYVVHFAAHTHVDRSIKSPRIFADVNVSGTLNLLEAARNHWGDHYEGKRFLYISTDEVYGELEAEGQFTEATLVNPRNPYSASKAGADHMARAYFTTYGFPVLVTRCSNNYGPYQYQEKFIPNCLFHCLSGNPIPIYGDGQNIRNWLFVEDHLAAIDLVLKEGTLGEVYNIGAEEDYTNLEVVHKITAVLKEKYHLNIPPLAYVEDRKGHDRRYSMDSSKIQRELGWQQKISFDAGIKKTIDWYLNNKDFLKL